MTGNNRTENIAARATSISGEAFDPARPGAVLISSVRKRFRKHTLAKKSYSTIKSTLLDRLFLRRFPRGNFITALDDVTIKLEPGAAVGLIGRNGSGKSTLLKLIAGIYRPDSGVVKASGRISALIELGAGFHPDFTGRENIYLGGVMYGMTRREIDAKYDAIVAYSGLEDFIDDPVRTYSSGMYMRLGFSLAVHTDPDILLIDEVLAVGDAAFIHRCHDTISDFRRRGKTMIFVAHDLEAIARWCDSAIWLERGQIRQSGEPRPVIDSYLEAVRTEEELLLESSNEAAPQAAEAVSGEKTRWGDGSVEITSVQMKNGQGEGRWIFDSDEPVTVEVSYEVKRPIEDLVLGVGILRADGLVVHGTNTAIDRIKTALAPKAPPVPAQGSGSALCGTFRYTISRLGLTEDSYFLDVAAHDSEGAPYDYHHRLHKFSVRSAERAAGVVNLEHTWSFELGYEARETRIDNSKLENNGPAEAVSRRAHG